MWLLGYRKWWHPHDQPSFGRPQTFRVPMGSLPPHPRVSITTAFLRIQKITCSVHWTWGQKATDLLHLHVRVMSHKATLQAKKCPCTMPTCVVFMTRQKQLSLLYSSQPEILLNNSHFCLCGFSLNTFCESKNLINVCMCVYDVYA